MIKLMKTIENRFRVATLVSNLGIGGTEKTIQLLLSGLNSDIFLNSVFMLEGNNVDRLHYFDKLNISVFSAKTKTLSQFLKDFKPHIVHWHRGGWSESGPFEICKEEKVPILIETNIFGAVDLSEIYSHVDKTLFVSKFCALRYGNRAILNEKKHAVLYNPIKDSLSVSNPLMASFTE